MEPEEIAEEQDRSPALEPESDRFHALVRMHEHTRRGWAAEEGNVELARKLAALRTELLERERVEREKRRN